jgi:circadian clock protein KaiC
MSDDPPFAAPSFETGVPGLDIILGGGLRQGGLYLIEGMAGAGKTILSAQIAFHRAARGEKVLYVTLIAESHDKLLDHLAGLSFFDVDVIAQRVFFLSGYHALMRGGLDGLLGVIAESLQRQRPSLLVIDGFRCARDVSSSDLALSKFIHELNTLVAAVHATGLLLAPLSGNAPQPEHTLVDGLIELNRYADGMRRAREIEVHKMRGRDHLMGRHAFRITDAGHVMFPRLEAQCTTQPGPAEFDTRLTFGLPVLDTLLGGGLVKGSTTTLLGPSGAGKTLLCVQFLAAGLAGGEHCMYLGFYEPPARLAAKAEGVGIRLHEAIEEGRLIVRWMPPVELAIDEIAATALDSIRCHCATRLVIDGIDGFRDSTLRTGRFGLFLNAFSSGLRERGVTTLVTEEAPMFAGPAYAKPLRMSALAENLVLLRYAESDSGLRRILTVLKQRESAHDPTPHELLIGPLGLSLRADLLGSVGLAPGWRA